MDLHILDERKLRFAQAICVNKSCLVINKLTLHRRLQQPLGNGIITGVKSAKIHGE